MEDRIARLRNPKLEIVIRIAGVKRLRRDDFTSLAKFD
jgi:hypothetical protein